MEISEIKHKIVNGDLKLAAHIVGITPDNAHVAMKRVGSKYHERVKAAFMKIIANREALLEASKKDHF